jgi:DNA-binding NarL/FixJ family response regulator
MAAVEALQRHNSIFSSRVSDLILDGYLRRQQLGPGTAATPKLSPREREVVQLLGEGKTTKEVATMLCVSVKTAETHRSNIMSKLSLHSIAELVLHAVRNDIVHVRLAPVLGFSGPEMADRTAHLRA